jgi:hypothetical protein
MHGNRQVGCGALKETRDGQVEGGLLLRKLAELAGDQYAKGNRSEFSHISSSMDTASSP